MLDGMGKGADFQKFMNGSSGMEEALNFVKHIQWPTFHPHIHTLSQTTTLSVYRLGIWGSEDWCILKDSGTWLAAELGPKQFDHLSPGLHWRTLCFRERDPEPLNKCWLLSPKQLNVTSLCPLFWGKIYMVYQLRARLPSACYLYLPSPTFLWLLLSSSVKLKTFWSPCD